MDENRETSETPVGHEASRPAGEGDSYTARMHVAEESDSGIVPMNHSNQDGKPLAESEEGRPLIKENTHQSGTHPTQSGARVSQGLAGVRKAAKEGKETKFTALLHHLTVDLLRESFYALKRKAAPGVDGVTWQEYETGLEGRLVDLHSRVHRGAYRAKPSRRVFIPKPDGRQRPLGVAALEDKVVQQAVVTILNQIYEEDFRGFSYGFRPGRSQHQALDALTVALKQRKVSYVLDADIRGFFDHLDLWVEVWRKKCAQGDVIVIRYADDNVLGFQHRAEADRFLEDFRERLGKFGLELHPDKTRRIEFGRYAEQRRKRRGEGKPETFDFLGFTHISGTNRKGYFTVKRQSSGKRMRAKLQQLKQQLRSRMHNPVAETGKWLKSVVQGYFNYHAVPGNLDRLGVFRERVTRLWRRTLLGRSQTHRLPWTRMHTLAARWLPHPRVLHPYPESRFAARYLR